VRVNIDLHRELFVLLGGKRSVCFRARLWLV